MNLSKIWENGFKTCGLHLFIPEALDYSKLFLKENRQQQSVEITWHDTSFVQTFEKYHQQHYKNLKTTVQISGQARLKTTFSTHGKE